MSDQMYNSLIGRVVQVNKSGPGATVGQLLAVKEDFLVVRAENQEIIYFTLEHIKTITEETEAQIHFSSEEKELLQPNNFQKLIQSFIGEYVRINCSGPDSRVGKLNGEDGSFIMLQTEKDGLIFYTTKHLKSLSIVVMQSNGENEVSDNSDEESPV